MILTSVALLAGHPTALVAAPDTSSGDTAFRDEVVAILRSDFPGVEVTLDQDPEQIQIGRSTLYLGNLRRKVGKSTGALRRAEILEFVGSLASAKPKVEALAESFMRAASRLRLQLIPNEYRDQVPDLVHRRFSDKLLVAYALDELNRYQLVTRQMFETWGVEQARVERIASENLEQASRGIKIHISPTGRVGHFATMADEDGYVAARMLLPVVMNQIREGLKTPSMVVGVPTRDILIAWSHDSENRDRLARLVITTMRDGPYSRSPELFHFSADGLRPLNGGELFDHKRQ